MLQMSDLAHISPWARRGILVSSGLLFALGTFGSNIGPAWIDERPAVVLALSSRNRNLFASVPFIDAVINEASTIKSVLFLYVFFCTALIFYSVAFLYKNFCHSRISILGMIINLKITEDSAEFASHILTVSCHSCF